MTSTRRLPYIGLQGGGVPAGGTLHAGHAYWESTITPVSAAPQLYPAPPEPSLYVTPTPRDLPSIVRKPYKLLRGAGPKIGGPLDDGFSKVAVVGTPGLGEFYSQLNQDTPMQRLDIQKTFEGYREPQGRFGSSQSGDYMNTGTSTRMTPESQIGNQMQDQSETGLVDELFGFELTNAQPMDMDKFKQSESGEIVGQFKTEQPNDSPQSSANIRVITAPVYKQKPSSSNPDFVMMDASFNGIEPTVKAELNASMKVGRFRPTYLKSNPPTMYKVGKARSETSEEL